VPLHGLEAELRELGNYFDGQGDAVAVLNDRTNLLKFGDITARLNDGEFEIAAVKLARPEAVVSPAEGEGLPSSSRS